MTEQAKATAAAAPAAPAPAVKPAKVEQNDVTRPKAGTATGRIWEIADAESAKAGKPATRESVLTIAKAEKINEATTATQFGRWCKFHGVKPTPKAKPVVDPAIAEAAKAAKTAEKAAAKAAAKAAKAAKAAPAAPVAPAAPATAS